MPKEAKPEMRVDLLALRKLAAKVKADLDAELDRMEAAGEQEMSDLAEERMAELASIAMLVQATSEAETKCLS